MKKYAGVALEAVMGTIAILGLLAALLFGAKSYVDGVDAKAFARGELAEKTRRDKADRLAKEEQDKREADVLAALASTEKKRMAAERQAQINHTKWQEAVRDAKNQGKSLAECTPVASPSQPNVGSGPSGVIRFTPEFVRLWDGAWSGLQGEQPVFPAAAGDSGAVGSGAIGPDEVLDNHGVNAEACSRDRRSLDTLMKRIEAAEKAWEAK